MPTAKQFSFLISRPWFTYEVVHGENNSSGGKKVAFKAKGKMILVMKIEHHESYVFIISTGWNSNCGCDPVIWIAPC